MTRTLVFEIQSFWHPGTGRGAGTALDAVTHRDSSGLPAIPGRSVRGLVRDAVERAAALGWYGADAGRLADRLFGWRPALVPNSGDTDDGEGSKPELETKRPADLPAEGCLRFTDAALPEPVAAVLADPKTGATLRAGLYRSFSGTAVDPTGGAAKEKSLRGMELVIPLTLRAQVAPIPGSVPPPDWPDLIDRALPLLRGVGADRNRGLGRVSVTLEAA